MSKTPQPPSTMRWLRKWIRRGFLAWAVLSTLWLANSFRTQGVSSEVLSSASDVRVINGATMLQFQPLAPGGPTAKSSLIFLCGSGVAAAAYAPLLRPLAEAGHGVFIIKLPYRFAPLESHKLEAMSRVQQVLDAHPEVEDWVLAGHSLGAALTCRFIKTATDERISGMVLIGTTHPKADDLSRLSIEVAQVIATHDGVAPMDDVLANRRLLPEHTRWVEITGGNHSQFGNYGPQLLDGSPSISREDQQRQTRAALRAALEHRVIAD